MSTKLYVGNLPYETTETDLQSLFEKAGQVASVNVMRDRTTGQARGFAFVEMSSPADANAAITQLEAARDRQTALTTEVLPRARLAIEPAVASYGAGQLPLVSVIEAIQALWGVQSDLIAADTQLAVAWTRLGRAIGSYEAIVP